MILWATFQEALYNIARAYQHVGLVTLAAIYYEKVLAMQENDYPIPKLPYEDSSVPVTMKPGYCNLHREAAYNLHLIYKKSGATDLARQLLKNYCSIWLYIDARHDKSSRRYAFVASKPSVPRFDEVPHLGGYKRLKLESTATVMNISSSQSFGLESIPVTWNWCILVNFFDTCIVASNPSLQIIARPHVSHPQYVPTYS